MLFILLYWRGVFILINIIIITENQYFVLGLIECLHKVFNKDFIKITRTNFQNYHQCLHDESSLPTFFFRHFIFCENITSKILKGDISTSKFKIIEMSKSVDELCRELLIDEYSQTNNRLSTLSPKEHRICTYFKMNYTDNKIAQSLNITKTTLSCHRRNILSKLNLKNKQQLYMFCKTL
ncbi:helix-turn-helix transcriptional regulator [Enterobacter asburiae]|uniref:helix-turn-helix transcriptional regulator n=2 Tax=Enterobacteriaceae TaxID=543 RepID=UPI0010CA2887|nr:hypothetical protein ECC18A13_036180 [Enterobacter sp. 18A13]